MGNDGGRIGRMTGGTYANGKQRFGSIVSTRRGKTKYEAGGAVMNVGPRTYSKGPTGSLRQAAARRVRKYLSDNFGKAGGWGSGRGANKVGVRWQRPTSTLRPSRQVKGMVTAVGLAGRRQLSSLRNTAAKRRQLKEMGIKFGPRPKKIGKDSRGRTIYGITVLAR